MWYLLTLEWKKQRRNLPFLVFIFSYLLLLPTLLLSGKRIENLPPPLLTNEVFFMFPTVWEYLGYVGNWLSFFFLGFLSITLVTSEYSYRTMRQNIINGLDRRAYFLSKLYFVLAVALFATLYYTLTALAIGYLNTEAIYAQKVWQHLDYLPRYFLMCLGYMSFGLFLGFLIRRTGIALFLYLTYIMFIEMVLRWGVHFYLFRTRSMHFYPMNAVEDLIPTPFAPDADRFLQQAGFSLFLRPWEAVGLTLIYTLLFLAVSYWRVQRSDL